MKKIDLSILMKMICLLPLLTIILAPVTGVAAPAKAIELKAISFLPASIKTKLQSVLVKWRSIQGKLI
jgi:hypothetical protein